MLNASVNNWHSTHFPMSAVGVSFQILPNPDRTHIFRHTVCIWGLMIHKHMYGARHTDNCCCCSMGQLCLSVPCGFTAHIRYKDKMSISGTVEWWWQWRTSRSTKKPNKSMSLLWTEYAFLQPADWCCCHVVCSFTIITQTQGTFVNHKEWTD